MNEIYRFLGTKGKTIPYKGRDYTLAEDIEWEDSGDKNGYELISCHAHLTDGGEMYWSVFADEIANWEDISTNIDGILYEEEDDE